MAKRGSSGSIPLRTWSHPVPRGDLLPLLASFPVAFAIHEVEEVIGMRSFGRDARARLSARLEQLHAHPVVSRSIADLSPAPMAVAVATVAAGAIAATAWAVSRRGDLRPWQSAFTVFAGHAATHIGQSVVLRAYVPGSVTAVAVVVPYSALVVRRLRRLGLWDARTIRRSLVTGIPAALLLAAAGHLLGRRLVR
jgi:hypothetical protein